MRETNTKPDYSQSKDIKKLPFAEQMTVRMRPYMEAAANDTATSAIKLFTDFLNNLKPSKAEVQEVKDELEKLNNKLDATNKILEEKQDAEADKGPTEDTAAEEVVRVITTQTHEQKSSQEKIIDKLKDYNKKNEIVTSAIIAILINFIAKTNEVMEWLGAKIDKLKDFLHVDDIKQAFNNTAESLKNFFTRNKGQNGEQTLDSNTLTGMAVGDRLGKKFNREDGSNFFTDWRFKNVRKRLEKGKNLGEVQQYIYDWYTSEGLDKKYIDTPATTSDSVSVDPMPEAPSPSSSGESVSAPETPMSSTPISTPSIETPSAPASNNVVSTTIINNVNNNLVKEEITE